MIALAAAGWSIAGVFGAAFVGAALRLRALTAAGGAGGGRFAASGDMSPSAPAFAAHGAVPAAWLASNERDYAALN
jgi:hypothetical protein